MEEEGNIKNRRAAGQLFTSKAPRQRIFTECEVLLKKEKKKKQVKMQRGSKLMKQNQQQKQVSFLKAETNRLFTSYTKVVISSFSSSFMLVTQTWLRPFFFFESVKWFTGV